MLLICDTKSQFKDKLIFVLEPGFPWLLIMYLQSEINPIV